MLTDGLTFLNTPPAVDTFVPSAGAAYPANPKVGQLFFNSTIGSLAVYSGSAWIPMGAPNKNYDLSLFIEGKPTANATLLSFVAPRVYAFPASFVGSVAKVGTAATSQTLFILKKNGTQIGTVTFESGANSGVFAGAATQFGVGDVLTVSAMSAQDATLADISISLTGTLP